MLMGIALPLRVACCDTQPTTGSLSAIVSPSGHRLVQAALATMADYLGFVTAAAPGMGHAAIFARRGPADQPESRLVIVELAFARSRPCITAVGRQLPSDCPASGAAQPHAWAQ